MKYLNKIILLFVFTISCISCDENENFEIAQAQEEFQITSPSNGSVIVLSDVNLENQGLFVSWESMENTAAPFTIEAALTGTNFESSYILGTSETTNFSVSVKALNTFLIEEMQLPTAEANSIDIRVVANEQVTQTVSVVLTPTEVEYPNLFLYGNFTNEWNKEDTIEMNSIGFNIFEIIVELPEAAEFAFYTTKKGLEGDIKQDSENIGGLSKTGENISGFGAGEYKITVDLNTNTFTVILANYPELYLVGDATAAGWNEKNNDYRMFKDADQGGLYHYTGYFTAGSIKLREQKNSWQPQWGKGDADGTLAGNPGTQSNDPNTISVGTAGYYTFTVNLVDLSYSLEAYDASGATEYDNLGVLGAATPTGWGSDTDFTKSSFDPHIWYMNLDLNESDGGDCDCGFKIRANDSWDTNWGGNQNPPTINYGVATTDGGKNIGVPTTGNYSIIFNTLTFRYSYVLNE